MPLRCTNTAFGDYRVESDSTDKIYRVYISQEGKHFCECVAYAISRNRAGGKNSGAVGSCKHLKRVMRDHKGCGWTSSSGQAAVIETICPACQSYTEEYRDLPDVLTTSDMEEFIKAAIALNERLSNA